MPEAGWSAYRVRFAAESPIHAGWHDLGLIQRTRYYIPARSLWGVLVAHMAPFLSAGDGMYQSTKERLENCLRATNFFPTDNGSKEAWLPRYGSGKSDGDEPGLNFGALAAAQFEQRFVFSQTSVALQAECLTAEEGALHESEFLSHVGRDRSRLEFIGYVLVREDLNAEHVKGALRRCAVGADRRYGWGRLRQIEFAPVTRLFECFAPNEAGFALDEAGKVGPAVKPLKGYFHLPAHLHCAGMESDFAGELEVVSGRDWMAVNGPGQRVIPPVLCWAPGSLHTSSKQQRFEIEPQGLWISTAA